MEQNQTPQELLTIFCCRCWDYEMDIKAQQQKFDTLSASYKIYLSKKNWTSYRS